MTVPPATRVWMLPHLPVALKRVQALVIVSLQPDLGRDAPKLVAVMAAVPKLALPLATCTRPPFMLIPEL